MALLKFPHLKICESVALFSHPDELSCRDSFKHRISVHFVSEIRFSWKRPGNSPAKLIWGM